MYFVHIVGQGPANATPSLTPRPSTNQNPPIAKMDNAHPDWDMFCDFDACEPAETAAADADDL